MDPSARLRMLFDDADGGLLRTNVGLAPQSKGPEPALQPDLNTINESSMVLASVIPPSPSDSELSGEYEDEYLASLAASAREAREEKRAKAAKLAELNKTKLQTKHMPVDGHAGPELEYAGQHYFCPALAISRFPYKYLRGIVSERVGNAFFDNGKFWARSWKLYYVYPPTSVSFKPLLLLARSQVQQFFDEINQTFNSNITIPRQTDMGVLLPFENDGTPLPEFLGTSTSPGSKEMLERSIPTPEKLTDTQILSSNATDRSFAAYKEKMEAAFDALRRKSKLNKHKKQRDNAQKLQAWCRALKRAQCYMGLRGRVSRSTEDNVDILPSRKEILSLNVDELAAAAAFAPLNIHQIAPFPFADEPIFVSIDIESNEKVHKQITEIGISVLDTLDLIGVAPGPSGCNWMDKIQTRHFRISEYGHVRNTDFVNGCPDRFEFGQSEWISIKQAAEVIEAHFCPPYSTDVGPEDLAPVTPEATEAESDNESDGGVPIPVDEIPADHTRNPERRFILTTSPARRNVILVGHNLSADITYMNNLGCTIFDTNQTAASKFSNDPSKSPITILDKLDTNELFCVLKRERQPSSLSKVLLDLELAGWNLHNAGNDAHYTMQALIGIVVKARIQEDEVHFANDGKMTKKMKKDRDGSSISATSFSSTRSDASSSSSDNSHSRTQAWKEEIERRVAVSVGETEARIRGECALWDQVLGYKGEWKISGEDVDGGMPKGLVGQ